MNTLRLGIVGAGRIASSYAAVVEACETVQVFGVADTDADAAERFCRRFGGTSYSSHLEMIDAERIEAIVVCTPPNTHKEISIDALRRGVHVVCEKPLALSLSDAQSMLAVANEHDVVLTMASKFRYVEEVLEARKILESGSLGELVLCENTFTSRLDMSHRWNSSRDVAGGGVLIDNGTHSVDLIRFMLGPIREVMAVEGIRAQGLEVEDTAQVFLRSDDGVRATIDLSWSIDKAREWYLEIYGSRGTVQIGWARSRYRLGDDADWKEFGNGYRKYQAMRDQLSNFAGAILHGQQLAITAVDALASVAVIEAAYRSMAHDDWVQVNSIQTLAEV